MKASYKIVWDMETLQVINKEEHDYHGPVDQCKPKTDPYAQAAGGIEAQQDSLTQQQRQQSVTQQQQADQELARSNQFQDKAQGSLDQFEAPNVADTPFYKALLTTGTEATSNAYQNAGLQARQRAAAAGYGYNQPAEQGSEDQLAAAGASELASQPNKALTAAAPMTLQAVGETAGIAGQNAGSAANLTGASNSSAAGAGSTLAGANNTNTSAGQLQSMASQRRQNLFKTLAGVGMTAAAPFTGGATKVALGAGGSQLGG